MDGDAEKRRRVGLALPNSLVGVGESSSSLAIACEEALHAAPGVYAPTNQKASMGKHGVAVESRHILEPLQNGRAPHHGEGRSAV